MSLITGLPCEVLASVLRNLDNMRYLLASILTCRHFYSTFNEYPGIAAQILRRQVTTALIPYSIAVVEASRLHPRVEMAPQELLDTLYLEPSKLTDRLVRMPVPLLAKMGHTHDVIDNFVTEFAGSAWAHLANQEGSRLVSDRLSLSSTEYFRFCRAFYRVELYFSLFRSGGTGSGSSSSSSTSFDSSETQKHNECFCSKHPPWQNEQIGCALEFLELKLAKASHDVLAHDIELGELGIDYVTAGSLNGWRTLWLSQGVSFIHELANQSSYDSQQALLESAFGADVADLYEALAFEDNDDDATLAEYTDKDLAVLFPDPDKEDDDKGPFEAWRVAYKDLSRSAWVMLGNTGLRERAYVLWDQDRLLRYNMLELFENAPKDSELLTAEEGYDNMLESFEERSNIWQEGGRGYWSADDKSRIVWD